MIARERGVVALTTTVLVALMLLLITTGVVAVQVNEQRQANDADKSVKAYYGAVAGAEKAMLDVVQNPASYTASTPGTCVPAFTGPVDTSEPNIAVTCTQVYVKDSSTSGYLQSEEAYQSPPITRNTFTDLKIAWHQQGADPDVVSAGYSGPSSLTSRGNWKYPALMEISDLAYDPAAVCPAGGSCPGGGPVSVVTDLLAPRASAAGGSFPAAGSLGQYDASCSPNNLITTGGYDCVISLSFNTSVSHIIRLRPRYSGTHYKLTFLNSGSPVAVDQKFVTIDVTAKDNDAFRRVVLQVPNKAAPGSGLDYVLFSDTDICKNLAVRDSIGIAFNGCP